MQVNGETGQAETVVVNKIGEVKIQNLIFPNGDDAKIQFVEESQSGGCEMTDGLTNTPSQDSEEGLMDILPNIPSEDSVVELADILTNTPTEESVLELELKHKMVDKTLNAMLKAFIVDEENKLMLQNSKGCDKQTQTESEEHVFIGPKKKFMCEYCDKSYSNSSSLSRHRQSRHICGPYPCRKEGCNKVFWRKDYMPIHIMKMHVKD